MADAASAVGEVGPAVGESAAADGEGAGFGWWQIARLGLVQACLGAVVVTTTSILNRVMVVELALPALLPGALVALHYAVQMTRPRWGHGSDGGARRTPWIAGGTAVLAGGGWLAALATVWMGTAPAAGIALALLAFVLIGLGVGAAGTSLLVLLARRVDPPRRASAATVVWLMMILGFALTAGISGKLLDPYSPERLLTVCGGVCTLALLGAWAALWRLETPEANGASTPGAAAPIAATGAGAEPAPPRLAFKAALALVWAEPDARRFTVFVFVSMLAYSAQDLILEPFAGTVFGYTPGQSTSLSGVQHGAVLIGMLLAAGAGRRLAGRATGSLRAWTVCGCIVSALAMAGLVAAGLVGPAWPFKANVVLLGVANGAFSIAAIGSMMALASHGAPGQEGLRMGLWGAAQAIAFGLGGLTGAVASDVARRLLTSPGSAYAVVFAAEGLAFLVAAWLAWRVAVPTAPKPGCVEGQASAQASLAAVPFDATAKNSFDAVVVGGGPAGATAAEALARAGHKVLLLDRAGRIKPCGGAIPPRLIKDFAIPDALLVAKARSARMVSPQDVRVDIPIDGGFVGMVDREFFDEWLRERAASHGAERRSGNFERLERQADGSTLISYRPSAGGSPGEAGAAGAAGESGVPGAPAVAGASSVVVHTRAVIGADGARSLVARQCIPEARSRSSVFAYHEIIATPEQLPAGYDPSRCDVVYRGSLSPDFYGWVFPHGKTLSIGTGSADKGFSQRTAVAALRASAGLAGARTLRREGAPLPMKPLPRWDNGRDVVLAGDAAGVVAPASGEGIYYAMVSGQHAAHAVHALLAGAAPRCLKQARKRFMREHGKVFLVLGVMQRFWYCSDKRRERFVSICRDKDVQQLTFDAYMNKRLVRSKPLAHARIFVKDMAHLLGLARV